VFAEYWTGAFCYLKHQQCF